MKLGSKEPAHLTKHAVDKAPNSPPKQIQSGELILPREYSVPSESLADYTILIAGEKKIGKTDFCAQWPDHFIIEGEPNNASHTISRHLDVNSWIKCKQIVALLEKEPTYCKTLVVDDIMMIYGLCFTHMMKQLGIEYPASGFEGSKAWNQVRTEFTALIKRIQDLPFGKIYTEHTAYKEYETRGGDKYTKLETPMGKLCGEIMDTYIQIWAVMYYNDNSERVIQIIGDNYVKAGNSLKSHFLSPTTGQQLKQIPMGNSAQEAYSNFMLAFNNKLDFVASEGKQRARTKT